VASKLVVLSGTGTEIGKTHVAEALLLAWRGLGITAIGLKPVESGVDGATVSDSERLAAVSAFHVKPLYALRDPVAPHLAAQREGIVLRREAIVESIHTVRDRAEILLVELPGGLFSPVLEDTLNADLAAALVPQELLVVAPDRLGVLHDVIATIRAAATVPLHIDGVVLVAPALPDLSTGTNAPELASRGVPVLASVLRGAPPALALPLTGLAKTLATR
jgi:dethiobiotin synthetase